MERKTGQSNGLASNSSESKSALCSCPARSHPFVWHIKARTVKSMPEFRLILVTADAQPPLAGKNAGIANQVWSVFGTDNKWIGFWDFDANQNSLHSVTETKPGGVIFLGICAEQPCYVLNKMDVQNARTFPYALPANISVAPSSSSSVTKPTSPGDSKVLVERKKPRRTDSISLYRDIPAFSNVSLDQMYIWSDLRVTLLHQVYNLNRKESDPASLIHWMETFFDHTPELREAGSLADVLSWFILQRTVSVGMMTTAGLMDWWLAAETDLITYRLMHQISSALLLETALNDFVWLDPISSSESRQAELPDHGVLQKLVSDPLQSSIAGVRCVGRTESHDLLYIQHASTKDQKTHYLQLDADGFSPERTRAIVKCLRSDTTRVDASSERAARALETFSASKDVTLDSSPADMVEPDVDRAIAKAPFEKAAIALHSRRAIVHQGVVYLTAVDLVALCAHKTRELATSWLDRVRAQQMTAAPHKWADMIELLLKSIHQARGLDHERGAPKRIDPKTLPDIEDLDKCLPRCMRNDHKSIKTKKRLKYADRLRYINQLSHLGYESQDIERHFAPTFQLNGSEGDWRAIRSTIYKLQKFNPPKCKTLQESSPCLCPFVSEDGMTSDAASSACAMDRISRNNPVRHPEQYVQCILPKL